MKKVVTILLCAISAIIYAQAPVVSLGSGGSFCNSTTLDAGNAGASYLWSTPQGAATTQVLTASVTGTYSVTVTNANGTATGSTNITILAPAAPTISGDPNPCQGQVASLTASGSSGNYLWWNTPTGGTPLGTGASYSFPPTVPTTIYASGFNVASNSVSYPPLSTVPTATGIVIGATFNANQTTILNSVDVYPAAANTSITMTLRQNGVPVANIPPRTFTLSSTNITTLQLDWVIPAGSNYVLFPIIPASNNGAFLYSYYPFSGYPYSLGNGAISLQGYFVPSISATYTNNSVSFFNWNISTIDNTCPATTRGSLNIAPTPIPYLYLPADTSFCGNTGNLNPGANAGADYLWSNSESTAAITVTQSGIYSVTAAYSNTQCPSAVRTTEVNLVASPAAPVVSSSLTICEGPAQVNVQNAIPNASYLWWDAPTNGQLLNNAYTLNNGATYQFTATQSQTLYASSISSLNCHGYIPNNDNATTAITSNGWGNIFDVTKNCILDSIFVYTTTPNAEVVIVLWTNSGATFKDIRVDTFATAGRHKMALGFVLTPGTNYLLNQCYGCSAPTRYSTSSTFAYPYSVCNAVIIRNAFLPGSGGVTNISSPLYDWYISNLECESPRQAVSVTVIPTPQLALQDSALCGASSYILDAGNSGAAFLWSDGNTSQIRTVTQTNNYQVTVTNGGICSASDNANIQFFQQPTTPVPSTVALCQADSVSLLSADPSFTYVWYDSLNSATPFFTGAPLQTYAANTRTYYVQASALAQTSMGVTDHPTVGGDNFSTFMISTKFNAVQSIILDSVAVYVNAPCSFTVIMRDENNNIVQGASRFVSVTQANTKVFIPLGFSVPAGNNYALSFTNLIGGALATNPVTYPIADSRISITGNSISTSTLYYFYDWHYSYNVTYCSGTREALPVAVSLPFNLPDSIYTCGPITLDATSPNAGYEWSTGSSTPTITVSQTGIYNVSVTATNGCTVIDQVNVSFPIPVGLANDGVLCGDILSTNYTNQNATFLWSTNQTTPTINVVNSGLIFVTVTPIGGCILADSINITGFQALPTIALPSTQAYCQQAVLDAGNAGMTFEWSNNTNTQTTTVQSSGNYTVTVTDNLGCSASASTNVNIEAPATAGFSYNSGVNGNPLAFQFTNQSVGGTTYAWNFGSGTPSSAVNPVKVFSTPGTYTVQLIATNTCGSDTLTQVIVIAGTDNIVDNALSVAVYPNPTDNVLNIAFADTQISHNYTIEMIDTEGRILLTNSFVVESNQIKSIDLSSLSAGLYYLRVISDNGQFNAQKVLITR